MWIAWLAVSPFVVAAVWIAAGITHELRLRRAAQRAHAPHTAAWQRWQLRALSGEAHATGMAMADQLERQAEAHPDPAERAALRVDAARARTIARGALLVVEDGDA